MHDVITVSIQADMELLTMVLPVFNQVDGILRLAGGCSLYSEGLSGGCTTKGGACPNAASGEMASDTTAAGSTG